MNLIFIWHLNLLQVPSENKFSILQDLRPHVNPKVFPFFQFCHTLSSGKEGSWRLSLIPFAANHAVLPTQLSLLTSNASTALQQG